MKLHERTERELLITTKGNKILVQTKQEIELKNLRKQQRDFIIEKTILLFLGISLGCCLMYTFLNS